METQTVQTENESLLRDINSKALLNTNSEAYNSYRMRKNIFNRQKKEVTETHERLNRIEEDMLEIKSLLRSLAQNRGN
jgi:hypothetical protein